MGQYAANTSIAGRGKTEFGSGGSKAAGRPTVPQESRKSTTVLLLCLLAAFFLRVYGVRFGLPYEYYWDEPTIVNRAVRFGSGDLNPHFFYYPAFYMYVLFVASGLTFVFGRLTGHYHNVQDFAAEYFLDPSRVYMTARFTTACIGTLAVLLTYLVGTKFFNRRVGLIGALFLAVSVQSASYSHIAITDIPHAFFIIAACIPLYDVYRTGSPRSYLATGLLIGLGMATKYLAVLLAPSLVLASWLHMRDAVQNERVPGSESDRAPRTVYLNTVISLVLGLAAVVAGFFIGSPYNLLNFPAFIKDFQTQQIMSQSGSGNSFGLYLTQVLPSDFGIVICLACVLGLALVVWQRKAVGYLFLLFPCLYFMFIARYPSGFPRYIIPLDPFVALLAAFAFSQSYDWVRSRLPDPALHRRALAFGSALILLLAVYPSFWAMLKWDHLMADMVDPRTQAVAWVETNIPSDRVVCLESLFQRTFGNPSILTDRALEKISEEIPARGKLALVRDRVLAEMRKHPVYQEVLWDKITENKSDMYGALQASGVDCLIVSSQLPPLDPALLARLNQESLQIQRFSNPAVDTMKLPSGMPVLPPTITIFLLKHTPGRL